MKILIFFIIFNIFVESHSYLASLMIIRFFMEEIRDYYYPNIKLVNEFDLGPISVEFFKNETLLKKDVLQIAVKRRDLEKFHENKRECKIKNKNNQILSFRPFNKRINCKLYLINLDGLWCLAKHAKTKLSIWT
ncbi:unnamed protein product [Brachionus calyciflorus]|uniref:Uncharacterized protein n=1 Tax=Brachionus calyciflorus TaxID=104777 RepID=A0A814EY67_9BILA|nr:unnamed protein product [Brachionus calyciflorus]